MTAIEEMQELARIYWAGGRVTADQVERLKERVWSEALDTAYVRR